MLHLQEIPVYNHNTHVIYAHVTCNFFLSQAVPKIPRYSTPDIHMYSTLAKNLTVRQILLAKCHMISSNTPVMWGRVKYLEAWTTTWMHSLRPLLAPGESTERGQPLRLPPHSCLVLYNCQLLVSFFQNFH